MADRVVSYVFRGDISGLKASLTAAGTSVADLGKKLTAADKDGQRFRSGLKTVGDGAGKVGLVAAAGLGAVVLASANFEAAMSSVQAATHESAGNMEQLRDAAIKAGAATKFSASEAAGGIENLAKAGVSTKDILGGGLSGALNLAAAGQLNVADAAEISATALTQFNLKGSDVPHVADLLAAGAGKAQGSVQDLGMALNQSGLVASQMGVSIEETTGTLAAFASAGLLGSDAGTSFKTMLLRLANPSREAAVLMERLGVNAYDTQGNLVSMSELAGQLQTAFRGQSQATRDAALATIFGSDAIRGANVLYSQGAQGISSWTKKVNDQGYAAETAAIQMDNLKGDLEQFGGSLETALIGAGSSSQGPLRSLVQGATDVVNAFNKMPGPVQSATTALLGITAVVGGGLFLGAKVIGGIASTRTALADLGVTAERTKGTLSGIGKGVTFVAALEGVNLLNQGMDSLLNRDLDTTNLGRSLTALSSGKVTGALLDQFGGDLSKFGDQANMATDNINALSRAASHIPLVGGFVAGSADNAVNNIRELDQALAGLVESGQQDQAAAVFEQLSAAAQKAGVSTKDISGLFKEYGIAVQNAAEQTAGAGVSFSAFGSVLNSGIGAAISGVAQSMRQGQAATESFSQALQRFNAVLTGRSSFRDYQAAIDAFTASLKTNGRNLNINTPKGRALQASLDGIASSALSVAKNLHGASRGQFLQGARASFIDAARKAGMTEGAAKRLATQLGLVGRMHVKPTLTADDKISPKAKAARDAINAVKDKSVSIRAKEEASAAAARARAAMNSVQDRSVTLRVTTVRSEIVNRRVNSTAAKPLPEQRADGGLLRGPGTSTSDSIPAYLSDGEYVVRAAAVAKYGVAMFDNMNAMRFAEGGHVQRFADGGHAKSSKDGKGKESPEQKRRDKADEAAHKRLRKEIGHVSDALGKARDRVKTFLSDRAEFKNTVRSAYVQDPLGGTLSGFDNQIKTESRTLRGARTDLKTLRAKGLNGALYQQLAASGNAGLVDQFAGLSRSQLAARERAFNTRNYLTRSLANTASRGPFPNAELKHLRHEAAVLSRELKALRHGRHIGNVNFNGPINGKDGKKTADKIAKRTQAAARAARHG